MSSFMNKSGYNIPLLLYSAVKKHIPAWTKKLEKRMVPFNNAWNSKKISNHKKKSKSNLLLRVKRMVIIN